MKSPGPECCIAGPAIAGRVRVGFDTFPGKDPAVPDCRVGCDADVIGKEIGMLPDTGFINA